MTATCPTPDCPEQGVPKTVDITLADGEQVLCGGCGGPCDLTATRSR